MQKKDAKRHKIKGGQRKKKKIPKKKDILFKKGTKGKKGGQSYISILYKQIWPQNARNFARRLELNFNGNGCTHIYTYFVKSS